MYILVKSVMSNSKKKICPLIQDTSDFVSCQEGKCAIWDKHYEQCSIVSVSSDIANLTNTIMKAVTPAIFSMRPDCTGDEKIKENNVGSEEPT